MFARGKGDCIGSSGGRFRIAVKCVLMFAFSRILGAEQIAASGAFKFHKIIAKEEFRKFIIPGPVCDSRCNNRIRDRIPQIHRDANNARLIRILNPVLVRVVPDIVSEGTEDNQAITEIQRIVVLGLVRDIGEGVLHLVRIRDLFHILRQSVCGNCHPIISRGQVSERVIAILVRLRVSKDPALSVIENQRHS